MTLRRFLIIASVTLALLGAASLALAQVGGGYDLTWNTVDGGGGDSAGGSYSLSGTLGQPDAGAMSGGSYNLNGGYWQTASIYQVYGPFVRR